uniref:Large ribosomal subunit protein uL5c n=1 Tax=Cymbomonas tetramitiformis TaxID=36881 RepID=A0A166QGV3_9CHLO|nr:ribosomal protein L15 [Cymbomonas tetramitiformis]ANA56876.1 ribosomal protein L15 [Cymbomonas tetramitiformis]
MIQRLKNFYLNDVVPKLKKQFEYTNIHQVPEVKKIVINRGLGEGSQNAKTLDSSLKEVSIIAGQRGIVTRSKKAIAGFKVREDMPVGISVTLRGEKMYGFLDRLINLALPKVREDMPVGISVTLRGEKMYGFLDRLINLALPRIRDFQGINSKSFDGHGNYSLGLEEQLMFPEIDYDKIEQLQGMDISIITNSKTDEEGYALLKELGMPFRRK